MKVKELIEELSRLNGEDIVIISDGNKTSPLSDIDEMIYVPDNTWSGDLYIRAVAPPYDEEDLYYGDDGQEAVVLWPVN